MAKTVKFTAQKAVSRPTTVKFKTNDGHFVTFKATEIVKKPVKVEFKTKPKK